MRRVARAVRRLRPGRDIPLVIVAHGQPAWVDDLSTRPTARLAGCHACEPDIPHPDEHLCRRCIRLFVNGPIPFSLAPDDGLP